MIEPNDHEREPRIYFGRALAFLILMYILLAVTLAVTVPQAYLAAYGASQITETWYEDDPTPDNHFAKGYESLMVFWFTASWFVYKIVMLLLAFFAVFGTLWIYDPESTRLKALHDRYHKWKKQKTANTPSPLP